MTLGVYLPSANPEELFDQKIKQAAPAFERMALDALEARRRGMTRVMTWNSADELDRMVKG